MSGISRFGSRSQAQASPKLNFVGSRGRSGITKFGAAPEPVQSAKHVQQAPAPNAKNVSQISTSSTTLGTRIDVKV